MMQTHAHRCHLEHLNDDVKQVYSKEISMWRQLVGVLTSFVHHKQNNLCVMSIRIILFYNYYFQN